MGHWRYRWVLYRKDGRWKEHVIALSFSSVAIIILLAFMGGIAAGMYIAACMEDK